MALNYLETRSLFQVLNRNSHEHQANRPQPSHSYHSATAVVRTQGSPDSQQTSMGASGYLNRMRLNRYGQASLRKGISCKGLMCFFDRLHSTLPVVDRALYRDLMLRRHHTDKDFAALILALCSLAVVGPVYQKERVSMTARIGLAKHMLASAAHLRTSYDFCEQPSPGDSYCHEFLHCAYPLTQDRRLILS